MNDSMIMQVTLAASPQAVFQALTSAVSAKKVEAESRSRNGKRRGRGGRRGRGRTRTN